MSSTIYFLLILVIISPVLSHVIISGRKSENLNAFEKNDNENFFLEPIYEYPAVTKVPIYSPSTPPPPPTRSSPSTPSSSFPTTRHTHIVKIPRKNEPSPLSVVVPEAIVYIGASQKSGANSFGGPSYADKEAKNIELLTDNAIKPSDQIKEEPRERIRYKDILVALALWNLANTFNQYETGSSESSAMVNDLDGFQVEPVSQEIQLRSDEILKFHNSTD